MKRGTPMEHSNTTDSDGGTQGGIMDRVRDRATAQLSSQKDRATDGLGSVAQAVRQSTQHLRDHKQDAIAQYVEKAADQVLAEAQAIHTGLRELGSGLTSHAERILRDIQAAHRRMTADLRQGERPSSAPRSSSPPAARPAARPAGNGFDGIDVPDWVEP